MTDPRSIPGQPVPQRVTAPEPDLGDLDLPWELLTQDDIAELGRFLDIDQVGEGATNRGNHRTGKEWVEAHRRYRDALDGEEGRPSRSWAREEGHQPSHDRLANIRKGQVRASPEEEEVFFRDSPGFRARFLATKDPRSLGGDWVVEHERYRVALQGQAPSHRWAIENGHKRSQTRLVNLRYGHIEILPEELEFLRKAPEFREAFLPVGSRGRERYDDLIRRQTQERGLGTSGVAATAAVTVPGARRVHRTGRQWAALHQAYSDSLGHDVPNHDPAVVDDHHASRQRLLDLGNGRTPHPEETELLQRSPKLLDHYFPAGTPKRARYERSLEKPPEARTRLSYGRSGPDWETEIRAYLDALGARTPDEEWARANGHESSHWRLERLGREGQQALHPEEFDLLRQHPRILDHFFPAGTTRRDRFDTLVRQMTIPLQRPDVADVAAMPVPGLHQVSGGPSARPPADGPTTGRRVPCVLPQR
ncbi:hypothetical protein ABT336_14775 [Micromonospora sp. NPDC000207]|uniref:hypothetical protein n=1 Tax=Micromonospora sp. NPDC000207 TaxID=3154246 RepID=UPI0033332A68